MVAFRERVKPAEATLHHFRKCRKEWLKPRVFNNKTIVAIAWNKEPKLCFDYKRYRQTIFEELVDRVVEKVAYVKFLLGLIS